MPNPFLATPSAASNDPNLSPKPVPKTTQLVAEDRQPACAAAPDRAFTNHAAVIALGDGALECGERSIGREAQSCCGV